jgi:hypothetical protein
MSFFPKEHGAYGQMIFPLVTSMVVSGATAGSLLFAGAIVSGFLVHEPLLVLLGFRGPRARREAGSAALWWVVILTAVLIVMGASAVRWMEPRDRIAVILPLVPAVYLFVAAASGKGKSIGAEVAVAIAFSLTAIPLSLLGEVPAVSGVMVALAFATNFVLATLAIRVVIAKVRGGGNPALVVTMRRSVYTLAILIPIAAALAVLRGVIPSLPLVALAPGIVVSLWIAITAPPPAKLRTVGWALVTTSAVVAALLIVTLRVA